MKQQYVVVDFDGTCVTHEYPIVGKDIGAVPILKRLVAAGHKLILFTMRSGKELNHAVKWFANNDIELFGIQTNPTQAAWTSSPKAYGQLIIDDAALGAPLNVELDKNLKQVGRPFIDWVAVESYLVEYGYLEDEDE